MSKIKAHSLRVGEFRKLIDDMPQNYIQNNLVYKRIQQLAFPFRQPLKKQALATEDREIDKLAKGLVANVKDIAIIDDYAKAACYLSLRTWKNIQEQVKPFLNSSMSKQKIVHLRLLAPMRGSRPLSLFVEEVFNRLAAEYSKTNKNSRFVVDVIHPTMSKSLGTLDLDLKRSMKVMTADRFIPHQEPFPETKTVDIYVDEVISGGTIRSTIMGMNNVHIIGFASKSFQQYLQSPLSPLISSGENIYEEQLPSKNIIANYYLLDLISHDNAKLAGFDFGARPYGATMPFLPAKKTIAATKTHFEGKSDLIPLYDYEPTYGGKLADAFVFAVHKKIRRMLPKLKEEMISMAAQKKI